MEKNIFRKKYVFLDPVKKNTAISSQTHCVQT